VRRILADASLTSLAELFSSPGAARSAAQDGRRDRKDLTGADIFGRLGN